MEKQQQETWLEISKRFDEARKKAGGMMDFYTWVSRNYPPPSQPLPPTPELRYVLDEKFPKPKREDYEDKPGYEFDKVVNKAHRRYFSQGFISGQSSMKQPIPTDRASIMEKMEDIQNKNYGKFQGSNEGDLMTREEIADLFFEFAAKPSLIPTVTDEEIEKQFPVIGNPHSNLMAINACKQEGAKWMRDTFAQGERGKQLCPKCFGEGSCSEVGTSSDTSRICPVCEGKKKL